MCGKLKTTKNEIGLSPQEMVFRGKKKMDNIGLRIIDFDESRVDEKSISDVNEIDFYLKTKSITWFNIDGLHDLELLRSIGDKCQLNNLILSDVLETNARPKIHEYKDWIYLSLKVIQYKEENTGFAIENLSIIFNDTMLISFQEKSGTIFEPVRQRIRNHKRTLRSSKTDYLAYALVDTVIDHYLYELSRFGEKIEAIEEVLLENQDNKVIEQINLFKKQLNYIRKGIKPAKEMILSLSKMESDFIDKKNEIHFKELVNNFDLASDTLDSYRELLSDQLNVYHMILSSRLNDIMKFLTIFSVIFIPLTFIAGIYGTNFDFIPELHFKFSYFIMLGIMALITTVMLIYFKRKKWL
ncbi:magnesium/cobalt transporter CorA [Lutimonas zeaxanthinifaciens]|uniref:magnesium/cobalt transporter CorA n=1 Tax=Lutimonas zeaxanthinifaciens TaxID=3060215 RepID=UPI00265D103C|nr:magnesium/cobalt transporter CorA [Lutimonas sp. YSD2104]WKK65588.1 magnesium/cobalt transporter CorA [Lutimonas sp. YSD2104]